MKRVKQKGKVNILHGLAASDLAFLLIIYFLTIAAFNVNFAFATELPQSGTVRFLLREEILHFEMDSTGSIIYENEYIDLNLAESIIKNRVTTQSNLALLLTVDGEAAWQDFIYFIELAQNLNIDNFSFNMRQ